MNNIQVFNYEMNGVRTVTIDEQPYFVARDVANILGYVNSRDAITNHVDDEDKTNVAIYDGRQKRKMTVINESGLYSLILSSKLPSAKKFKRWVTSEVLPALRTNGYYQLVFDFYNAYDVTENDIIVREMAHRITQAGYKIGEKRLFEWLRYSGYLCRGKTSYNQPTQKALELGLFRERYTIVGNTGGFKCSRTPKITPKGQKFFLDKFMKKMYLLN